jgi:hypothetical protein
LARWVLQYERSQHPPDKEYADDGSGDVNYPVTNCFRFSKIEHSGMVVVLITMTTGFIDDGELDTNFNDSALFPFRATTISVISHRKRNLPQA